VIEENGRIEHFAPTPNELGKGQEEEEENVGIGFNNKTKFETALKHYY
jgi:hypothetical protein